jgi:hypothetical protein
MGVLEGFNIRPSGRFEAVGCTAGRPLRRACVGRRTQGIHGISQAWLNPALAEGWIGHTFGGVEGPSGGRTGQGWVLLSKTNRLAHAHRVETRLGESKVLAHN